MCLSNIYRSSDHTLLMENTSKIRVENGEIVLVDLFGRTKRIFGEIESVDLEGNEVVISCEE
ncbi:MAG: CooT family nickel-binding protein [Lachnospiraceae bacterium]|nr:CooT family nickel-binding protein [Lachnospiraceae bacterium]